ncbi:MAG: DUF86 domain-containing protein [Candidatus Omnitrophica bacterium]|nr:DUF86 domain-containing protein [Candidatus Omnitrophota bacterium]
MSRDFSFFIQNMVDACERIPRYVQGMSVEDFQKDEKTRDAVLRSLEIIGEAAKHVPEEFRNQHARIEWRKLCGLRDVVVHEYFGLDLEIVWDLIQNEVPRFQKELQDLPL